MQGVDIIFSIAVLIMSVVVHEVSHGYAASFLGDQTARLSGRLTLNPLKHLDPIGSVIFPLISYLIGGFIFGWAKPVLYNPYNLRNQRWGELIVSIAGPISNLILALIFGSMLRFAGTEGLLSPDLTTILAVIVQINIVLAVFNLVPIPPLDGSKVLLSLLPFHSSQKVRNFMETYGMILVIFFILFIWRFLSPVISFIFSFITGLS
jgi:Zn-dependent protease